MAQLYSNLVLLNNRNILEISKTTATSNSNRACIFKYPTGFSQSNTLLLCVRYFNSERPIVENGQAQFWGGDFSVSNLNVQAGKEVTAFLAKII